MKSVEPYPQQCCEPGEVLPVEVNPIPCHVADRKWGAISTCQRADLMPQSALREIPESQPTPHSPEHKVRVVCIHKIARVHQPDHVEDLLPNQNTAGGGVCDQTGL